MSSSKQEEHRRQVPKEDYQKQRREKSSTRNEHHREGRKVNKSLEMVKGNHLQILKFSSIFVRSGNTNESFSKPYKIRKQSIRRISKLHTQCLHMFVSDVEIIVKAFLA